MCATGQQSEWTESSSSWESQKEPALLPALSTDRILIFYTIIKLKQVFDKAANILINTYRELKDYYYYLQRISPVAHGVAR